MPPQGSGQADHADLSALLQKMIAPFLAAPGGNLKLGWTPDDRKRSRSQETTAPLEALCRVLAGIAPAIEVGLIDAAPWHQMIGVAFDPDSAGHLLNWETRRPLVELAFLAQALLRAPERLWGGLSETTKAHVIAACTQARTIPAYQNNWLLFPAMIETFLLEAGVALDWTPVDHALACFDDWYKGDGVYGDGPLYQSDYYNSYVIHPTLIDLIEGVAELRPALTGRLFEVLVRAQRYGEVLERMIAPDGSYPPLGRSICYRGGAFHLLAQLALKDMLPVSLPPAQVRSALMAVARRTLQGEANWRSDGWLTIGVSGAQPEMGEDYVNTGSLYLASLVFLPLGLPMAHRFWAEAGVPFTQQRLWELGESVARDRALDEDLSGQPTPASLFR